MRPRYIGTQLADSMSGLSSLVPPFAMQRMSVRVLPLPAYMGALQNLIDSYVNFAPPEVGHFKAIVPYVYLMLVNYGRLAEESDGAGWLRETEFLFTTPAFHYVSRAGTWHCEGVVWIAPFIFVNSGEAMKIGRELDGWPKNLLVEEPVPSSWILDPVSNTTQFQASAPVFPSLYCGVTESTGRILRVEWAQPDSLGWAEAPARALARDAQAFTDILHGAMWGPIARDTPATLFSMLTRQFREGIHMLNLNLKQFRSSQVPDRYCYQALTLCPMKIVAFNRGGILGDTTLNPTGGYRVILTEWASQPIVSLLGLRPSRTWRDDQVDMHEIAPAYPFWYDVDMTYSGSTLAWRSYDRVWHTSSGETYKNPSKGHQAEQIDSLFNSTLPSAQQTIAGPFRYPDSTVRVLCLESHVGTLRHYLETYIKTPLSDVPHFEIDLWQGPDSTRACVFLTITNSGPVYSGTNNVGDWPQDSAVFYIPVRAKIGDEVYYGLVPSVNYTSSMTAEIANSEVLGWSTALARFEFPSVYWHRVHTDPQCLLSVTAQVLPAFQQNQQTVWREVLAVDRHRTISGQPPREASDDPADVYSQALKLFSIKQFHALRDPGLACYQSFVEVTRRVKRVRQCGPLNSVRLRVCNYASSPVVSLLGLEGHLGARDGSIEYVVDPCCSFWARLEWEESLGRERWYRVHAGDAWKQTPSTPQRWSEYFGVDSSSFVQDSKAPFWSEGPIALAEMLYRHAARGHSRGNSTQSS